MSDKILPSDANEVVIEHPDIPGAIARIHLSTYSPGEHKLWDPDTLPWMDGSGNPIEGRAGPSGAKPKGGRGASGTGRLKMLEEAPEPGSE